MEQFEYSEGRLRFGAADIRLTPKERAVFSVLAKAAGEPVTTSALIEMVWGASPIGTESLHRCISTLRNKLSTYVGGSPIATVYGYGYQLTTPVRFAASPVHQPSQEATEGFRQAMEMIGRRSKPEIESASKRLAQLRLAHPGFTPAFTFGGHCEISIALFRYDAPLRAGGRAVELAEAVLSQDAASAEALSIRGFVTAVIAGNDSGFDDLDRAVSLAANNWLMPYYRGFARAGAGDFAGVVADMESAWSKNPGGVGLVGTYAYVLHCAGKPERALSIVRDAEDARTLSATANAAHAIVASDLGFHEEAIAAGERAARTPAMSATMSSALAYALARAGRGEEARAKLADITSDDALRGAPSMLAPVYLALGDDARARSALREAEDEACPYRHLQRFDPRLKDVSFAAAAT